MFITLTLLIKTKHSNINRIKPKNKMCHKSCATCLNQQFTGCLTCPGTNILFQSSCYCSYPWSTDCSQGKLPLIQKESSFQGIFRLFQSIYVLSFILLIFLYCLKIRLPLSYRVLSGLQFMSLMIYSPTIYLDYEDFFVLRFFNLLSGPYQIDYRLQTVSTSHALQTYILLGFFIFLFVILYFPSQTFGKKEESIWQYLKSNSLEFMENFYYFGGKMMFTYIGMVIMNGFTSVQLIVHFVLFIILILVVIVRLIMEYHKNSLSEEIFQAPLYIYCMLMNAGAIGIPLITQSTMLLIVYLAPLGLLILIAVLNKDIKILDSNSIKFFIVEVVMAGLSVLVSIVNDSIRTYILLIVLIICFATISVEMTMVYYGGIDYYPQNANPKAKSNKIQPALNDFVNQVDAAENKQILQMDNLLNQNKKKGKYF